MGEVVSVPFWVVVSVESVPDVSGSSVVVPGTPVPVPVPVPVAVPVSVPLPVGKVELPSGVVNVEPVGLVTTGLVGYPVYVVGVVGL